MTEIKPGDWWWGVYCKRCETPIGLFEDKSQGEAPMTFAGPGKLSVKCPNPKCMKRADYGTNAVQRFQAVYKH